MKQIIACFFLLSFAKFPQKGANHLTQHKVEQASPHIFIITLDGFRWQEMFNGIDTNILNNENYSHNAETMLAMYGGESEENNRKKLMPFFWSIVAAKGQLYGNRKYDNKVNVANLFSISYPGYNEMFTGKPTLSVSSNSKKPNTNKNIFEYLNTLPKYKNKIAIFTSWDVFPFILNEDRSGLEINSGLKNVPEENYTLKKLNIVQNNLLVKEEATRNDMLTFVAAKEYLTAHRPSVFYLGLGETDEYAHSENYDMYLQKANEADKMIADLWYWAQSTEGYKNNTTFIITTDHGRGSNAAKWMDHGFFTKGSSQTWLAILGKNVQAQGEIKSGDQLYQKQIAQTIAYFLGEDFGNEKSVFESLAGN
jgi:hypothetical protein